jgi:predicted phage terminase large subunit-like protein
VDLEVAWRPNPGPQTDFLTRTAFEVMYGGAAGGGKSDALLVDAGRYLGRGYGRAYHAILFRRTFPELEKSLIKRSHDLYPYWGGRYNEQKKTWRFPGGELIEFGHLEHEKSVHAYQGAAFQFIGFDELTSFTETQYLYLFSRCRSAHGIRCRVRSGTNPGNEGHEWVFKRWQPWLDPKCATHADGGDTLYFLRGADDIERVVPKGTPLARSRCFIPAKLEDNPKLYADGEYEATLNTLDPVTRRQLRSGDWLVKPGKGLYFQRTWWRWCNAEDVPPNVWRVRYWDLAATEPEKGKDPDWTQGVKAALTDDDGIMYVEDIAGMRGAPGEVEKFIQATAEADGTDVAIGMEQEPGASGKSLVASYQRLLNGFSFWPFPKRADKVVSAGPVSAQVYGRRVFLVRGPWNEALIQEAEQFPEGSHDDRIDGLSGAHTMLTGNLRPHRDNVGTVVELPSFEEREVGSD